MPDWRNPEDYAYTGKLWLHDWAWEFLRRNPAYRLAWARFVTAAEADRRALLASRRDQTLYEAMNLAYTAASEEFGLVKPADPDHSAMETAEKLDVAWWNVGGIGILQEWNQPGSSRPWPGYPRSIGLSFDFTLPLEPQIEQAKDILLRCRNTLQTAGFPWEEEKKPKVRVDRHRFTLYLRLLDAERSGISLGEMGRRLFKSHSDQRKSAKNALQQAKRMAESGYRELLMMVNVLPYQGGETKGSA